MATGDENVIMKQPTSLFPPEETEPEDGQNKLRETKDVQSDKKKKCSLMFRKMLSQK